MEKVRRYAREIVPAFSAYAYFRVGTRIARAVSHMLYRVRIGVRNDEALAAVDPASSVIFVINHRSNMDYVLVTYVAATSSALSYAVGEWAKVWGLSNLIRSMGAYFIARDSGEALYRKVLSRYVHMATSAGVTQAIFPEGGLSRDGKLRPPKFGLLSYMVAGFDPLGPRDVVFIPVAVNYDRVLEDRMLTSVANVEPGKKPVFGFNAATFARHFFRHRLDGIARRVASLRIYLREFWRAGVAAKLCRGKEDRFSRSRAGAAPHRDRKARQRVDGGRWPRGAGAAGLAGRDRHAGGG